MASSHALSVGSVKAIYAGETTQQAVLQVLELKKIIPSGQNVPQTERYRMVLSDSRHYQQSMLSTQLNALVREQKVQTGCLVRLLEYVVNDVAQKRIIIVLNLEPVTGPLEKIGNPVNVEQAQNVQTGLGSKMRDNLSEQPSRVPSSTDLKQPQTLPEFPNKITRESEKHNASVPLSANSVNIQSNRTQSFHVKSESGPVVKMEPFVGSNLEPVQSIASLNPYQNKWIIKGRVSSRGEIRHYQNAKGEGSVFSFEIMDSTASIKVTAFRENASSLYKLIEIGKVYRISKGVLKPADKRFNKTSFEYEMIADNNTEVVPVEDVGEVPNVIFHFTKIANLENIVAGQFCDVLGIVKDVSELSSVVSRTTGITLAKRTVVLMDDSLKTIRLTLWKDIAENLLHSSEGNPILLCKGVRRGDFNGISLDATVQSCFEVNPDIAEAHELRGWYETTGKHQETSSLEGATSLSLGNTKERKTILQASEEDIPKLINDPRGVQFIVRGYLHYIRKEGTLWYTASPDDNKKVTKLDENRWVCDATGKEYSYCNYRYILSVAIQDATGSLNANAFDDVGSRLIGRSAEELAAIYERDRAEFDAIIDDVLFKPFIFRIRAKQNTWNDELRLRYHIVNVEPIHFSSESQLLLNEIQAFTIC
ncbi:Replication factor A protein 1 [Galdieria sulphuraria]|uniref:Replication protein A subunit n=1 Tax=Galdieria sulphuraria TaxID=130081 RepID=M2XRH2_GALSU|nr:replication factor A1 [Galdieria sulphuraria]EME26268.1 replication factor A1 [Galdieria sulphuraria]GJD10101.1 Replication factor A protein 1 [Galdieria sulphuraria]|eukprot:XP_005702788.1 replication factor A1 [Galdieria sulphuraria]